MAYQSLEQCRTATTKTPDAIKAPELLKQDAEWYDTHPRLQQQYRRPCRRITACRRSSSVTVRGDGSHGLDDHREMVIDGADSVNSDAHECLLFFPIIGILQDGCWAVKLSMIWQLLWQPREEHTNCSLQRGTHLGVYHCHSGISGMVNTGLSCNPRRRRWKGWHVIGLL